MTCRKTGAIRSWIGHCLLGVSFAIGLFAQADAQTEQRVDVTIRDFTFIATQAPLVLNVPAVITIRNDDRERHNFDSALFQGILTEVETGSVTTYGRGIGGLYVDPQGHAVVRFTVKRPGRYEFRCTIHPNMSGELLLLNIQAV
ncbi:cupredoxin domain-containing protein [Nitrospira sp. Nam74]